MEVRGTAGGTALENCGENIVFSLEENRKSIEVLRRKMLRSNFKAEVFSLASTLASLGEL